MVHNNSDIGGGGIMTMHCLKHFHTFPFGKSSPPPKLYRVYFFFMNANQLRPDGLGAK